MASSDGERQLSEQAGAPFRLLAKHSTEEGKMKAVVIVAHPDDETIWSGGLIMGHSDWDWTALSLCRADDPDRSAKFKAVCEELRAVGIISDLDDSNPPAAINHRKEIGHRIMATVGQSPWDLCVTHGINGEYGHQRHKEIHAEVLGLVRERMLVCGELWTFAYECDTLSGACSPAKWGDILVELTEEQLVEKRRIVEERYGYARDSFELRACISPEAFRRVKSGFEGARR